MAVRKIDFRESLETVWDECTYTEARAAADDNAKDLLAPIAALCPRALQVKHGQYAAWQDQIRAQAKVDALDFALDQLVEELSWALDKLTRRDHRDPLWTRYMGTDAPSAIRRMALGRELERVQGWPALLAKEPESELKTSGTRFESLINAGRDAVANRTTVTNARAEYRSFTIQPFIDAVNEARTTLYSQLLARSVERKLSRTWPDEFFLHRPAPRAQRPQPDTDAATP